MLPPKVSNGLVDVTALNAWMQRGVLVITPLDAWGDATGVITCATGLAS
jgi:hypothetical protein